MILKRFCLDIALSAWGVVCEVRVGHFPARFFI